MRNIEVRFHIDKETYAESEKARILAEVPKDYWHQFVYKRGLFEQGILSEDEASETFRPIEVEDEARQIFRPITRSQRRALPRTIKIKSDELEVRNWTDVLVQTAEWLIRQGKLTRSTPPIESGPKRYLINSIPEHKQKNVVWRGKKLSNGLHIETNNDAAKSEKYARRLLSYFGYDGDDLELVW